MSFTNLNATVKPIRYLTWFSFCIKDHPEQPSVATGYIIAIDADDAPAVLDDERANVYPLCPDFVPPTKPNGQGICYERAACCETFAELNRRAA